MINSCHNYIVTKELGMNHKILLFVSTIILNIQTGTCELPQPLAFYDFEDQLGDTVKDKGSNNLDAEINRSDEINFDSSGAVSYTHLTLPTKA